MKKVHAIFENGVFRPTEAVDLPDRCEVEFEPRPVCRQNGDLRGVYSVLSERFQSGQHDVAERHNEHQP